MKVIKTVSKTETTAHCEVAVLELDGTDKVAFDANPLDFVNKNKVFGPQRVKSVDRHPDWKDSATASTTSATATWLTMIVHYPSCRCSAASSAT